MNATSRETDLEKLPVRQLIRMAEAGDATAQGLLVHKYHNGLGVARNCQKALDWARRASERGNYRGQSLLGFYHLNGFLVDKDYGLSRRWYLRSARQGYLPACYSLGVIYEKGYGVAANLARAKAWYLRAAQRGDADSQCALGRICYDEEDWSQAFRWHRQAAEQGVPLSQATVGSLYMTGKGVEQDKAQAVHWIRLVAEGGSAWGQLMLGKVYMNGDGLPVDYRQSRYWLKRAARQGNTEALFWLGNFYREGHGVKKNLSRGSALILRAAEKGHNMAQLSMGFKFEGQGDQEQAYAWYLKAAEQGNAFAQFLLFDNYMTGKLTGSVDLDRAFYWLDLAAAAGETLAIEQKKELEEFLFTSEEINNEVGLPSWLNLPMRRGTYWRMYYSEMPFYEELLADLQDYISLHPVEGFGFLEDIALLEEFVKGVVPPEPKMRGPITIN